MKECWSCHRWQRSYEFGRGGAAHVCKSCTLADYEKQIAGSTV